MYPLESETAELGGLLGSVDRHIPGSGDDDGLALEGLADGLEHLVGEVAEAVSGGLGPGEGSPGSDGLSCEDSCEVVPHPLVLAVHEPDLPSADPDVSCGDVGVGSDVPLELGHEGLAEAHDLGVGLALGVEVGSSLSSSDGEGGEAVLEDLLESEELQDGQVDGGVEPEPALVGSDGGVELDAVSAVDLHLSVVVDPRDAEHDDPLGLNEPLDDPGLLELGPRLDDGLEGLEDLLHCLEELGLVGVALLETVEHGLQILVCDCHAISPW